MKIKWNGHSCFTITSSNGTVFVTDPYESGSYGGGIAYGPVDDRADAALVSHDHPDHNHVQTLQGSPVVIKKSGEVKGVQVTVVEAAHDTKGGAERGKNLLFAFDLDGVRVAFMGDLGHALSASQAQALGKVDVLLTPVGGVFTIDPDGAAKLIGQLAPRVVIPMHYKTAKCGFPLATIDDFAVRMTQVKKTGKSEIQITTQDLPPAGPEVWVLDYAR